MYLPSFVVAKAAVIADVNAVFAVLASGQRNLMIRLSDQPDPDSSTTPTHYAMMDMSALDTDVAEWQAMTAGDLPEINGVWGEEGVIGAAAAQAAVSGGNMQVYSAAGINTAQDFVDGVLLGAGLYRIPDEL